MQGEINLVSKLRPTHVHKEMTVLEAPTHCQSQASQISLDVIVQIGTKLIAFRSLISRRAVKHKKVPRRTIQDGV